MANGVVMSGPLSKESRYALIVDGYFGAREIKNLLTFLQLQLEWAQDDESAASANEETPAGDNHE